jgi:PAS domain S-box-containing protein
MLIYVLSGAVVLSLIALMVCRLLRSRSIAEAKRNEKRYRELFDNLISAFALHEIIFNEDGVPVDYRFLDANPFFEKLTGLSRNEIVGKTVLEVLPATEPEWIQRYAHVAQTGEVENFVAYSQQFDRYFEVHAYSPESGKFATVFLDITERIRTQQALAESEKMYRELVESVQDGITLADDKGCIVYVNPALANMLEGTPQEIQGCQYTDFIEERSTEVFEQNQRYHRQNRRTHYEVSARSLKGNPRNLVTSGCGRFDENGRFIGSMGVVRDLTQYREMRRQTREMEARYMAMFQHMSSGVAVYESDGQGDFIINDFNPAAERITHVKAKDVEGRRLTEAFPNMRQTAFFEALVEVDRTGEARYLPPFYYSDDIRKGWRENYIYKLDNGETVAIFDDVTERIEAMRSLAQSEERLSLALDAVSDGLWDWGIASGELYFSNRYYTMLGYEPGEFPASFDSWKSLLHPDDAGKAIAEVDRHLSEGMPFSIEFRARTKDGGWKWILGRGRVVETDEEGRPTRMIGTHIDIDSRKKVEAELVQAKEMAEAANQSKSEFLANMSHEIRTPINGIMGMLQLLGTTDIDEEQQEYVRIALDSSRSLTDLLSDILDLSMAEAGRMTLREENFDINHILDSVGKVFSHAAEDKGLAFDVKVARDVPAFLLGDPVRLRQVVFNLVGNAIKFTAAGSVEVSVSLLRREGDLVRLELCVEDAGIGIPKDKQRYIFESFTQVESSFSRPYQGAGLGLQIVKRIVDLMDGRIELESSPGNGASFCVEVNMRVSAAPVSSSLESDRSFPRIGRDASVLVVEDERVNRLSICRLLEKEGFRVTTAANGREALDALEKSRFDLILMDVQMPVMDGVEATRIIRNEERFAWAAKTPIVALTAHAMKGDKARFLEAGMDGYLSKPVEMSALMDEISRFAGGEE